MSTELKRENETDRMLSEVNRFTGIQLDPDEVYGKMKNFFLNTFASFKRVMGSTDVYIMGHSERVMKYTMAIGREMALDAKTLENLRIASLLHDIGKIGVKESILMKPAKLLGYERRQIRMHPVMGAKIVEPMDDSYAIRRGILEHHERYDGKGYPNRLKGEEISIEGRIIAVADVFDALTTDRPYQKGHSSEDIFLRIQKEVSLQFDPNVVAAFVRSFDSHPEIWKNVYVI